MTKEKCINCNSQNKFKNIYSAKKFPIFFGAIPSNLKNVKDYPLEISICKNCNLIQQSKKINERVVNKIYESYYYNCPAPTISNIGTSEINKFLKYFKGRKNKKGKVLEIACFDGYILRKLKQEKWDVYGCDPSPTTKSLIKVLGEKRIKQNYFSQNLFDTKFDIIIFRNLLEHMYDIHGFLRKIKKSLNKNGKIYIDVPNVKEILKLGGFGSFFHQHISYFSIETLNNILIKNGFIIKNYFEGNPNMFIEAKVRTKEDKQLKFSKYEPNINFAKKKYNKFKKKLIDVFKNNKKSRFILFGASSVATTMMYILNNNIRKNIVLVVDNDLQKHNKYLSGSNFKIKHPKDIKNTFYDKIFILTYYFADQVKETLKKLGIRNKKIITLKL